MKALLTSVHAPNYETLFNIVLPNHVAYCEKHKYSYTPHYMPYEEMRASNHNSYLEFIRAMLPMYDVIMTVGADVLIMNTAKTICEMFDPMAGQQIADEGGKSHMINNEVILWCNCPSSLEMLDHIIDTRFEWIRHGFGWQYKIREMLEYNHCLTRETTVVPMNHQNSHWSDYKEGDWIVHFYHRFPPVSGLSVLDEKIRLAREFIGRVK